MAVLSFVTCEKYGNSVDLYNDKPGYTDRTTQTVVALDIFGFVDEEWLGFGENANTYALHYSNEQVLSEEFEMGVTMYLNETSISAGSTTFYMGCQHVQFGDLNGPKYTATRPSEPGIYFLRPPANQGGEVGGMMLIVIDSTGEIYGQELADFDLAPTGLYFITIRVRNNTGVGQNDGKIEVWINRKLMYSTGTANFDNEDMTWFSTAHSSPYNVNTRQRNFVYYDAWTTLENVPPIYRNAVYLDQIDVVSSTDYTYTAGGSAAVDIKTALNDDADDSAAISITPDADLVLRIEPTAIPYQVATDDVAQIFISGEFYRSPQTYSNPSISISDTNTTLTHATIGPFAVNAVGAVREAHSLLADIPAGVTLDEINFTINSGT